MTSQASPAMAAPHPVAGVSPAATADRDSGITHFEFSHHVFKSPGARFVLRGQKKVPTFCVDMGELEGLVDIAVLRKEFRIMPDSPDGKLIELAVAGLRYVPDIKPQDAIPSEILTGKASWSINAKHKQLAEQRLQIQLLSWVSGKETLITDPSEIELFLGQIENREKLRTAFRNAAVALGREASDTEFVVKQLELLARELAYIEALRDRYALIPKIDARLTALNKSYGSDRNAKLELGRVQALLRTGIAQYTAIFVEADAQTGEIIAALKSIGRQIKYIRKIRDDLHFLLMLWEPCLRSLPQWQATRSPSTDKAMTELYRFLAPRFSSGRSLLKRKTDDHPAGKAAEMKGQAAAQAAASAENSTTATQSLTENKNDC